MSLNVTPVTGTANEIAAALLAEIAGNTTGFSNIQATITGKPESFGKFTGDPFGLTSGIVLSTGFATQAVGPNQFENLSGDLNGDPATNGGVFDEAVLTITFDSASATKAFFSYVFASDEFVEFGGSEFNDKFELLINGVNAAKLNNGDEISVNALVPDANDPTTWSPDFIDNTGGQESQDTEFDGYTKFLNFEADINAGANTIAIRLKDFGDNEYDSAVFIKQGSFGTIKPIVPTPPPAPTAIDLLTDTATTASASTTDNRTYEATPDFSGQGSKAGNIIKLFSRVDGLIGQTTIAADRTWTIANASVGGQDLLVGEHRIFAIEYDAVSGLASRRSSELSIFIDSPDRETDMTAPTAPANLDLVTASDDVNSFGSQTNTDNDTNDRTPTISGEAEPNSVITLYSDKDGAIGSARVGRDGKWAITATQLRSGDHVITAEARDWAGNVSGRSTDLNLSVRNVPSAPDLTAASDTGTSPSDNLTLDSTPTFQGVAEAGSTVELFIDGASVGTVTADAQGKWAFTSTALAEGVHTIQARATNRQTGTYDDPSKELRFTIDRTLPLVTTPDLSASSDNGPSNSDDITSIKSPSFTGTADPGSTVTVASSLDGVLGTAIADATGKWTLNVSTRKKLQSGNHQITAQAVDAAGNQSPISAPLSLTSLPDVSAPDLKASSDSGVSSSDNYTNDTTPTFTGTGELGSTVTLFYLDGTGTRVNIGSIVVSTDDGEGGGLWEITTTTLPEGVYDIRAEAEKSGFTSFTSNLLQVTIDTDNNGTIRTDAPANLDLTTATDSGTDTADNITTNNRPTFTGTGVAGNSIELFNGATRIGTAIVRADGTWEITPAAALALGDHDISARQIDKAGNISDFSPVLSAPNKVTIVPRPSAGRPDLITADDSGISPTDNLTKNNTPTLTGTGSIGSTIEIFDGAAKIGSTSVDASGNWSFTAPTLSDRTHTMTAKAIDIYGNVSDASTTLSLTIDTTPPAKPVLPDLTAATDSGSSNSDNITSDATPTFTGTTETNGRVEVFIDNVSQGFATVTTTTWSYTPSANLSEGNHQITVKSIDRAGNESVLSDPLSFAIDTTAPTTPINPPDLIAADDTGSSNSDNITRKTTPQFTGTVATDAVKAEVTIRNAIGAIVSTQVVDVTAGNWSYTPATALAAGNYTIAAKAIDSAGNISATSPALSYTIDPSISSPTITTISNDTGVPNDRITRDNTLILNGTAEANSSVEVFLDGTSIGTVTADSTGNWSLNHTATPLADRTYIATATATDAAGNTATSSNATIVVDTAVPNAPIVTSISTDTGASTTDGITSDRTLTINGTAEANSTVEIFQGVTKIGTVTTNASGVWSYDYTGTTLADGTYSFTASAIDQAANTSAPSAPFTVVIDNAAPSKPVIASITNDTATPADGITSDDRLIISGTAEANSSVDVFQGVTRIGTVTADSTGNWSLDYTGTAIAPGSYILTARSTDTAGNPSVSSDPFGLTIDTTAPTAPTAPDMVNADDSGASAIDNITNVLEPEFQGTAEANSTIRLIDDLGNEIGTGTADAAGNWRIKAVPRRKGSQSVKAIAIDKAGNISAASGETPFEIDDVAPAQPAPPDLTIASDTGASNTDNITGDDQPEFAGTAEAGSQIALFSDRDGAIGTATVGSDGRWTLRANKILRKGSHKITARAIDRAGNPSPISTALDLQILTVDLSIDRTSLAEGGTAILTATLAAVSTQDVTVNLALSGTASSADYTLPTSIVIRAGQLTGTAQISGVEDFFAEGAETLVVDVLSVENAVENGAQQVTATLTDNDTAGVTVSQTSLFTSETGTAATFDVVLTSRPIAPVTVTLTSSNSTEGTIDQPTLTFTPDNWNQAQTVRVTGRDDANQDGNVSYAIETTASSSDVNYNNITVADVTVTNVDNDTAGITVTPVSIGTTEAGGTAAFNVVLNTQPIADVTVTLTGNSAEGTLSTSTLTFTPLNWNTAQTVTVTGREDAVDDGDITYTIQTTATSSDANYSAIAVPDVAVTNADNDTAGVIISPLTTTATEDGTTGSYSIVLASQPTADVTVRINNGGQTSTSATTLIFTAANWNQAQTVTVTAANDNIVEGNHSATIAHSIESTDARYSGLAVPSVTANLTDNDTAGVLITPASGSLAEGGATDTYQVVLSSQPIADVTVAIANGSQTSTDKTTLTFTAANWNIAQAVTVTAIDDAIAEGTHTSTISHTVSSSDANYSGRSVASVALNITDNDSPGVTVTPIDLTTTEAGGTAAFSVVLTSQPTADVVVTLAGNAAEGSLSTSTLTFTPLNWNTAQTVTVTGQDDLVDDGNVGYSITTSLSSTDPTYAAIDPADVTVTNTDNDAAGISIAPLNLTTTEAGGTATFTVALNSQPTSNVMVNLVSSQPTEGSVPAAIEFTPENWNQAQTVTVTGVDDARVDGDVAYVIQTSVTSSDAAYAAIDPADVAITNSDNDSPGILLTQSNGSTRVIEGGNSDSYTLVLTSQPTANVTVSIASDAQTTVSSSTITFTPENWDQAQTVTVTAVNDAAIEGNHSSTITHTVSSSDPVYSSAIVNPVIVTVGDNDSAGIQVTPIRLTTGEDGTIGSFRVALTSQPTADVVLTFASSNPQEGTLSQSSLTFTAANWNQAQTVTVNGVDDAIADGDKGYSIATTISSTDADYNGLSVGAIDFINADNDRAGVSLTPTQGLITTEAGGTATFNVVLTSRPTADVTINLASSNPAEGQVANSITFSAANWNLPQTVTVTGVNDDRVDGDMAYSIRTSITSTDVAYAAIDPADVNLINRDNEINAAPTTAPVSDRVAPNQVLNLNGMIATDADGSVATIAIDSLPDPKQGVLYLGNPNQGGVAVQAGQRLRLDEAANLFFQASATFQGVQFTYSAIDNLGKVSSPGVIVLSQQVGIDPAEPGCGSEMGIVRKGKGGKDKLSYTSDRDRLTGMGGNDRIQGGGGGDLIRGNKGNDRLFGDGCNDLLMGGFGNDRLRGGTGYDILKGGRGRDILRGDEQDDRLMGGGGNDRLRGGTGHDRLSGGTGRDRIWGNAGDDRMQGGDGNDRLRGGRGRDVLRGNAGRDRLIGGGDHDLIGGGGGNDRLGGGRGRDRLRGRAGNDRIWGGRESDLLQGGLGNDRLNGGAGNDLLQGQQNHDRLRGRQGRDRLAGGGGNDRLWGNGGRDRLSGGQGSDFLRGGIGHDRLVGREGRDVLVGGAGDDLLTGGRGRDRFVCGKRGTAGDRITDFQVNRDLLDLRSLFAKRVPIRDRKALVNLVQVGSNTQVEVDLNGKLAGGGKTIATLENVAANSLNDRSFLF